MSETRNIFGIPCFQPVTSLPVTDEICPDSPEVVPIPFYNVDPDDDMGEDGEEFKLSVPIESVLCKDDQLVQDIKQDGLITDLLSRCGFHTVECGKLPSQMFMVCLFRFITEKNCQYRVNNLQDHEFIYKITDIPFLRDFLGKKKKKMGV
mgnify:CR=1 FL=1